MNNYQAVFEERFLENLRHYGAIRDRIKRQVDKILTNPYSNTEFLVDVSGKLNLRGCRSVRVGRNFRVIFIICEECRRIPDCEYCFCDELADHSVVFLTVGPHDRAYNLK